MIAEIRRDRRLQGLTGILKTITTAVITAAIIGGAYYGVWGNPATVPESECRSWRSATAEDLASCRESNAARDEVIRRLTADGLRMFADRFNQRLEKLAANPKSRVDAKAYELVTAEWIGKQFDVTEFIGHQDADPLAGRQLAIPGRIEASPAEEKGDPEMSCYLGDADEGGAFVFVPLNIEDLNRYERECIKTACEANLPGCIGTVYGTVRSTTSDFGFFRTSFVLQQVDIERVK
jgi:hypothetical protein